MKNLEIYGVQEMDIQEMKKTDGGGIWGIIVLGIFIVALTIKAFEN